MAALDRNAERGDIVRLAEGDPGGRKVNARAYQAEFGSLDGFASSFIIVENVPALPVNYAEALPDGRRRWYVDLDAAELAGLHVLGNVYAVPDGYSVDDVMGFIKERV